MIALGGERERERERELHMEPGEVTEVQDQHQVRNLIEGQIGPPHQLAI